jgi:glycosyltransferase involved in cell wall biosynthesis
MDQDTLVVIPCFNEARRLRVESFVEFLDATPSAGLVFVNDGSTDDTETLLKKLEASRPNAVRVTSLQRNVGKAEAVRTGMNTALAGTSRYVAYWDADLSTPLAEVSEFRSVLERKPELLVVTGARIRRLGAEVHRGELRHYLGRIFATLASLVLRLPVYDTQCGAKMFRASDVVSGLFAQPFESRWIFDVEVLARLVAAVGSARKTATLIYEYPLPVWHDIAGSKLGSGHMVTAIRDLLRIRSRYRPRHES